MAFSISGASIRNPIPALVLFAVLLTLGVVSFRAIPITRAPNVDVPVVSVTVTQAGAAPAELETQVTRKVEDSIASVTGVKHITSSVTDGASVTLVELRLEISSDRALNDVRDAVSKIRADLPRTIDEPIIERIDVVGQAIQTFAASAPGMTPEQLSWFIDDTVLRALQGVTGVGRVERIGGVQREIEVDLDPDRLAALGVTAGQVNDQVRATNVDLAGGRGEVGGHEQAIRTLANAGSVAALADSRIVLPGGREVRLSDVASVTDGFDEPRRFARLDGSTPVVAFAVYRAKGASDVTVADRVRAKLDQAGPRAPRGHDDPDRRLGARHLWRLRFRHALAARGRGARHHRGVHLPAGLARHAAGGGGAAALGAAGVLLHARDGLLAELRQPAGHHAGDRHPGGRRDRRDREHRPPHPHGQVRLARRGGGGGRDRAGGGRHHADHRGGVRAGQLHGRHPRAVLQAVRPDRGRRRAGQPAGGPAGDAGDGGLLPQAAPGAPSCATDR